MGNERSFNTCIKATQRELQNNKHGLSFIYIYIYSFYKLFYIKSIFKFIHTHAITQLWEQHLINMSCRFWLATQDSAEEKLRSHGTTGRAEHLQLFPFLRSEKCLVLHFLSSRFDLTWFDLGQVFFRPSP